MPGNVGLGCPKGAPVAGISQYVATGPHFLVIWASSSADEGRKEVDLMEKQTKTCGSETEHCAGVSRRTFIRGAVAGAALYATGKTAAAQVAGEGAAKASELVVAKGDEPAQMVRAAIDAYGGMGRFVKKGNVVLVKPNIAFDRVPEQAGCTNPDVVGELVRMCLETGASKVKVYDRTVNPAKRTYPKSGIAEAAEKAGAEVSFVTGGRDVWVETAVPKGVALKSCPLYKDALGVDVFINVPIAKHHNNPGLTLAMKNLMGVLGGNRGALIHSPVHERLPDLATVVRPQLNVLDGYRILLRGGPSGGSLDDVAYANKVIVGTDIVAVDAYGATLFGKAPSDYGFIVNGNKRGLGECDLSKVKITEVAV